MPDSIQTLPRNQFHSSGSSEPELPVLPHNASELVAAPRLHIEDRAVKTSKPKLVQQQVTTTRSQQVPPLLAYPYTGMPAQQPTDSLATSIVAPGDSVSSDSTVVATFDTRIPGEIKEGIVLVNPASEYRQKDATKTDNSSWNGMSWIYLALAVIFCISALKFKGNKKFIKVLFADLTETRMRQNAFDETVRETSLLVLLNLVWVVSAGVILWETVRFTVPGGPESSLSIPDRQPLGIAICSAIAGIYILFLFLGYAISGNVFTDSKLTRMWLKGAGASSALQAFFLFPIALLLLNYPDWTQGLLIAALALFVLAKLMFLVKSSRIFFHQISSWLLFLYYLCSLEIVPLILTYVAAVAACAEWL